MPALLWNASTLRRLRAAGACATLAAACAPTDVARIDGYRAAEIDGRPLIVFNVPWPDARRAATTHDALWVFAKYRVKGGPWHHVSLDTGDVVRVADDRGVPMAAAIAGDGRGVFLARAETGSGTVRWRRVSVAWNTRADDIAEDADVSVRVFAVEMVYVAAGPFAAGDGEIGNVRGNFHGPNESEPYVVTGEQPIPLGGIGPDRLGTHNGYGMTPSSADDFGDDRPATLPASFPKGTAPFYMMRYELKQGEYAAFLNTLTASQLTRRVPTADPAVQTGVGRYTITSAAPYSAAVPTLPAHSLTWMDAAAYADWAALRPLTELEFEKAARGTDPPVAGAFAWGTLDIHSRRYFLTHAATPSERVRNPAASTGNAMYATTAAWQSKCLACLDGPLPVTAFERPGATRVEAGLAASGAAMLSGNLAERYVTVGHPSGRRFDARHGDGELNDAGNAAGVEVMRWPGSTGTGTRSQVVGALGSGFRGGGWTDPPSRLRVSDRESAATPDNSRSPAFGYRFGRSAADRDGGQPPGPGGRPPPSPPSNP